MNLQIQVLTDQKYVIQAVRAIFYDSEMLLDVLISGTFILSITPQRHEIAKWQRLTSDERGDIIDDVKQYFITNKIRT